MGVTMTELPHGFMTVGYCSGTSSGAVLAAMQTTLLLGQITRSSQLAAVVGGGGQAGPATTIVKQQHCLRGEAVSCRHAEKVCGPGVNSVGPLTGGKMVTE